MSNTIFLKNKGEVVLIAFKIALKNLLRAKLSELCHISYVRIKKINLFFKQCRLGGLNYVNDN